MKRKFLKYLKKVGIDPCWFCKGWGGSLNCLYCGKPDELEPDYSQFKFRWGRD